MCFLFLTRSSEIWEILAIVSATLVFCNICWLASWRYHQFWEVFFFWKRFGSGYKCVLCCLGSLSFRRRSLKSNKFSFEFVRNMIILFVEYPKWDGGSKKKLQNRCCGSVQDYRMAHLLICIEVLSRADDECRVKSYLISYLHLGKRRIMPCRFGIWGISISWRNVWYFPFLYECGKLYFPCFFFFYTLVSFITLPSEGLDTVPPVRL